MNISKWIWRAPSYVASLFKVAVPSQDSRAPFFAHISNLAVNSMSGSFEQTGPLPLGSYLNRPFSMPLEAFSGHSKRPFHALRLEKLLDSSDPRPPQRLYRRPPVRLIHDIFMVAHGRYRALDPGSQCARGRRRCYSIMFIYIILYYIILYYTILYYIILYSITLYYIILYYIILYYIIIYYIIVLYYVILDYIRLD